MLRTIIQTAEEGSGKELPIPPDLLSKVQRAAGILEKMLGKVGEKIDIQARWWFDPEPEHGFAVLLSLSTADKATLYPFPKDDLRDDETIRRRLWTPIGFLIPLLEEEVDRRFESVRRGLEALSTSSGD